MTGTGTGEPITLDLLRRVREASDGVSVVAGSGVHPGNVGELRPMCDAAIVGTYFKEGGEVEQPVDAGRVRTLVDAWTEADGSSTGGED